MSSKYNLPPDLDISETEDFTKDRIDRAFAYIVTKLASLDTLQPSLAQAIDELRRTGLERLDTALVPIYQNLVEIAQLGTIFSTTSRSSVALNLGVQTFIVDEHDRDRYAAPGYILAQSVLDPLTLAYGSLQSYDRITGTLRIAFESLTGEAGKVIDNWTFSAAGSPSGIGKATTAQAEAGLIDTACLTPKTGTELLAAAPVVRQDGSKPFTAVQAGVSPGNGATGDVLITASWATKLSNLGFTTMGASLATTTSAANARFALGLTDGTDKLLTSLMPAYVSSINGLVGAVTGVERTLSKGIANGYAGLDASAKIPTTQLPASVLGDLKYQGGWNAATNTPAIPAASSANMGWFYVVKTAGTTAVSGALDSDWQVGDWLVSNGSTGWDKIDNTDLVKSVAGLTGAITVAALKAALALTAADVGLGTGSSPSFTGLSVGPQSNRGIRVSASGQVTATYGDNGLSVPFTVSNPSITAAGQGACIRYTLANAAAGSTVYVAAQDVVLSDDDGLTPNVTASATRSWGVVRAGTLRTMLSMGDTLTTYVNSVPSADNTLNLGSSGGRWANGYFVNLSLSNALTVSNGGTGSATAAGARTNLGLGTSDAVSFRTVTASEQVSVATASSQTRFWGVSVRNSSTGAGTEAGVSLCPNGTGAGIRDVQLAAVQTASSSTTADFVIRTPNSDTPIESMRILAGGAAWLPGVDNVTSLGSAAKRLAGIYAASSTISTSDARTKLLRGELSDAELDAWGEIRWCVFQMTDALETKGEEARLHAGLIAQAVEAAFAAQGLDAARYALWCADPLTRTETRTRTVQLPRMVTEWVPRAGYRMVNGAAEAFETMVEDTRQVVELHPLAIDGVVRTNDFGEPVMVPVPMVNDVVETYLEEVPVLDEAGEPVLRLGLRYDHCFAFEAAWSRRELQNIKQRITSLEQGLAA